jgi:hypothetical protein
MYDAQTTDAALESKRPKAGRQGRRFHLFFH